MVKNIVNKSMTATSIKLKGFTDDELAAIRERSKELRENKMDGESAVLEKIAVMSEPDRTMAKRLHTIIKQTAPALLPKTWYGMPAYANKDGKVVCFFRTGDKFKERYAQLGFNDAANLDEGTMWPVVFALTKLTTTEETKIAALVKKAVS